MSGLERGRALLDAGDYETAVAAFMDAVRSERSVFALVHLGVALTLAGRWQEMLRLVELSDPQVPVFHHVCLGLMERGDYEVLAGLHEQIPESHPVAPVAIYFAGVAAIEGRRFADSLPYFIRFKQLVLHNIEIYRPLLSDSNFNLIFRQGTLVEPPPYVAALDDGSAQLDERDPPFLLRQQAAAAGRPLVFACCLNDLYFLRFAGSLVETLAAACGDVAMHFHVYGKQKDFRPHFEALEARHSGVSFGLSQEPEPLGRHAPYYAAGRFVVMPKLAELYGRDIVMLDADALVRRDLTALHARLSAENPPPDFACFDTGRTEPASVYQATLMYFAHSPGCRRFVRLLRRYVLSKLDQPPEVSWLLDQASLFSVSLYLEGLDDEDFTFRRLDQMTGGDMSVYVDSAGTQDEKHALVQAGSC